MYTLTFGYTKFTKDYLGMQAPKKLDLCASYVFIN